MMSQETRLALPPGSSGQAMISREEQGLSWRPAPSPLWPHSLQNRAAEGPSGRSTAQSTPALARTPEPPTHLQAPTSSSV